MPELDGSKKMFVFVSHGHYDHYSKSVYGLRSVFKEIYYILSLCLPDRPIESLLGYNEEAARWCHANEKMLWKTIVSRKHLYTPDITTTQKYFENRPCTFLSDATPGNIGAWVGFRIIQKFVDETRCTAKQLMENGDAQDVLTRSKYKP